MSRRACLRGIAPLVLLGLAPDHALGQTGGSTATTWVSYLGGSMFEQARDVAVDSAGNVFIVGGTQSPDYPTTSGAYDTSYDNRGGMLGSGGTMEVFVTKLSPSGQILWSTFVGGPNYDRAYGVEVDAAGDVYVAGRAGAGFPTTTGVVQASFAGDSSPNPLYGPQDGFVFKLSADGQRLLWSTYFGGGGHDFIRDLDVDAGGNVYVGVADVQGAFPHLTSGAFQSARPGNVDNVVAKLDSTGTRVIYASYLGGSGDEGVPSVRVDGSGSLYVASATRSPNLPTTPGAYQPQPRGGHDAMVARVAADGRSLVFCTFLGGSGNEAIETHHLVVGASGEAIVAYPTNSVDSPTSTPSYQRASGGSFDAFLAVLSADGTRLLASTYLGGPANDGIEGVAVDASGIYVGGATQSSTLPSTGFQPSYGGMVDAWVARFSTDLSQLHYLSYLGGVGDDLQRSLWIDGAGHILSIGQTSSSNFPVASGAQMRFGGGTADAYVAKLPVGNPPLAPPNPPILLP